LTPEDMPSLELNWAEMKYRHSPELVENSNWGGKTGHL